MFRHCAACLRSTKQSCFIKGAAQCNKDGVTMPKMTAHEVLTKLNEIRQLTSPPNPGETKQIGIDQIVEADGKLLSLQERLLDDYGNDPQSTTLS